MSGTPARVMTAAILIPLAVAAVWFGPNWLVAAVAAIVGIVALLEFFARHPNTTFSAEAIITRVWPSEKEINPLSLRTYITRLRAKLDDKSQTQSIIETVHGEGYRLVL